MEKKSVLIVGMLILFLIFTHVPEIKAFTFAGGRFEVKGYIRHQQVFRSEDLKSSYENVQARTTLRLECLGNIADRIGCLEDVTFFGVLEPFYDAVFDIYSDNKTWGGIPWPNYPNKQVGFMTRPGAGLHHGDRDDYAWKGYHNTWAWLKEYTLAFDIGNLYMRIGKQVVTWGRSDIFRLADIVNPNDFSWHFIFEGVEETRIPLHIIRGIYDVGDVGPFADAAFEFVFNPGDITGDYLGYEGLPWNAIPEPGIHHWGRHDRGYGLKHAEWGVRLEATIGYVNFTLNYFNAYVDSSVLDLSQFFGTGDEADIFREYPRAQWIGFTVEYEESVYTKCVLRGEFLFVKANPYTIDVVNGFGIRDVTTVKPRHTANALAALARHPNAIIDRDTIKYVIGVDRPTWIRHINSRQTVFLSAQLFGTHILHRNGHRLLDGPYPVKATEFLVSFATWTDYMAGRLRPWAAFVYDFPSDVYLGLLSLQYIHGNHWIYKAGANLIAGRKRNMIRGYGGVLGSAADKDEVYFSIQYQF
jgi:hypothetical protein